MIHQSCCATLPRDGLSPMVTWAMSCPANRILGARARHRAFVPFCGVFYLVKAIGPGGEKSTAWYLYSEIIYEHLRIVAKHTKNPMLALSLIFCLLTKYRWVLQGLR